MGADISDDDRRVVGLWAADCAERVLSLFEERAPGDGRPRAAIEGLRVFGLGGQRTGELRSLVWAALAAAREVADPVAAAAARAAGYAAGTAFIHTLVTPHQINHVLGPAVSQAQAHELAGDGDPAIGDEEIRWAVEHASPAVRDVVRRLPVGNHPGRTRRSALLHQLEAGLRS